MRRCSSPRNCGSTHALLNNPNSMSRYRNVVLETLRSVLRFEPFDRDPVVRRLRRCRERRRPPARGAQKKLPAGCSTTSTAAPRKRSRRRGQLGRVRGTAVPPTASARDVSRLDPSTTLLGRPLPIPLVLAPTGFTRIADPQGELAVRPGSRREQGLPYTLSTLSTRSHRGGGGGLRRAEVVPALRGATASSSKTSSGAPSSGYEALMITVDGAVFTGSASVTCAAASRCRRRSAPGTLVDGVLHPAWTWAFVRSEPIRFANVTGKYVGDGTSAVTLADYINSQFDPSLSWADLAWLRSRSRADRAQGHPIGRRREAGGRCGRRGDRIVEPRRTPARRLTSPARLVAPVVDAVGDQLEVICDGGIRRGSDIVKAVTLGRGRAWPAQRVYLYGLGAGGERGVQHVVDLLTADVRRTMALIGARTVAELDRDHLHADGRSRPGSPRQWLVSRLRDSRIRPRPCRTRGGRHLRRVALPHGRARRHGDLRRPVDRLPADAGLGRHAGRRRDAGGVARAVGRRP